MGKRSAQIFGAGLAKAAISPLSLSIGATTGTGAVLIGSWWMLGVTAGSYVLAMALNMSRAGFWKTVGSELRRRPPRLPHPGDLDDERARLFAGRLARAREDRGKALTVLGIPAAEWPGLERVLGAARSVEERAAEMIALVERLGRYLLGRTREPSGKRPDPSTSGADRNADDPQPSSPLPKHDDFARRATHHGGAALESLFSYQDTVAARLDALVSALEALPHRIVSAKFQDASPHVPGVTTALADMEAELCCLEGSRE